MIWSQLDILVTRRIVTFYAVILRLMGGMTVLKLIWQNTI
jgi:hypothetical protein